jgi:hypothetical protein
MVAHPRAGVKRQIISAPAYLGGHFLFDCLRAQRGCNLTLDNSNFIDDRLIDNAGI